LNPEIIGKVMIFMGVLLIVFGLVIWLGKNVGLGRLPGDILIKTDNFTFYFPLVTGLIVSIILTIIINLLLRK